MINEIKRGDMFFADLVPGVGSEQNGYRPVIILSNNVGNKYSPTVVIAAITSKPKKNPGMPTHYPVTGDGLEAPSVALLEQIQTIDKQRLDRYIGRLNENSMKGIDRAIAISLGLRYAK